MKKVICLVLALSLLIGLIPTVVLADDTVTLRFSWWGGEERHQNTLKAIEIFEASHPNIKIVPEYSGWDGYKDKLLTQLAGGTAPDIMQLDQPWLAEMVGNGANFVDFNTVADKVNFSDMSPDFINGYCSIDGKLVGLPTGLNGQAFFQNTAMLNEYNIAIPEQWTWENLIPAAKALHEANPEKYMLPHDTGVLTGHFLPIYLAQLTDGDLITEDYTIDFTVEDLTAYFKWVEEMFAVGGFEPESSASLYANKQEQSPKYLAGDFAIMCNWCSTYYDSSRECGFTDAVGYPCLENGKNNTVTVRPSQVISLNGASANLDAAAEFVNFFFNNDDAILALATCRSIPSGEHARSLLAANNMVDPQVAKSVDLAAPRAGKPVSSVYNNTEVGKVFSDNMEMLSFGRMTAEEAAAACYEELLDKLDELQSMQ